MFDSDSFEKDLPVPRRAKGYTREDGSANRKENTPTLPARGSSAGGGYSTAADLLKFSVSLKAGILPSPESSPGRGLGIAGGAPGLNAALEWDPVQDYTIIVLSNYDPPSAERIARQIREWLPK
jgi:D-alanyl-D-alanine carboxypeptidase